MTDQKCRDILPWYLGFFFLVKVAKAEIAFTHSSVETYKYFLSLIVVSLKESNSHSEAA